MAPIRNALVSAGDVDQLERLRAAGPEKGLVSLAGGWKGSEELADLQIASTALHHDLTLVTDDLRHFRRVPGLSIETVLADGRVSG